MGTVIISGAAVMLSLSVLVFYVGLPLFIEMKLRERAQLINGSETWEKWSNVTIPVFFSIYFYNVTNPDAVLKGSKIEVEEVGPYVWQEKRFKNVTAINDEEDTATYQEIIHYYFRPDMSSGTEEDILNVMNIPFISVATMLYQQLYPFAANYILNNYFIGQNETIIRRYVTVRDISFGGVELHPMYRALGEFSTVELPSEFGDGTSFAYFNGKNGTPSAEFVVKRGSQHQEDFGRIVSFNKQKQLPWWNNQPLPHGLRQHCNDINGTDGSIFPPYVNKETTIRIFTDMVCRSIYMTFRKEIFVKDIDAYHFEVPGELLEHPDVNEDNRCFCIDPGHKLANNCLRGIIRLFACKGGAPLAITQPHFVGASKEVQEGVIVKKLNHTLFVTELDVEPVSGLLIRIFKRIQVNLEYQTLPDIQAFDNVPHTIIPICWIEEKAEMDDENLSVLREKLLTPLKIIKVCRWVVVPFFALTLMVAIIMAMTKKDEKAECYSMDEQHGS